jgi:hypothetical protein
MAIRWAKYLKLVHLAEERERSYGPESSQPGWTEIPGEVLPPA